MSNSDTRRQREREREQAAYEAQGWTPVMRAIATRPEWQHVLQLQGMLCPRSGERVDGRTREGQDWHRRSMAVVYVWCDLIEAGLVEIITETDTFRLTAAGRRWLQAMDAL